jgi:thiamine biosynthesis lipoprotein ApbE
VSSALINFGESSLYALGEPQATQAWPILVRGLAVEQVLGVLWIKNRALSTSHSFRGCRTTSVSHILDPHTGLPLSHPCLSTIVSPSAILAEALSTAVLVAGGAWRDLLARFTDTEGLYVGPDGVLHDTTGLVASFQPYAEVT